MVMPKPAVGKAPEIDLVLETLAETPKEIGRIARGHDDGSFTARQQRRPGRLETSWLTCERARNVWGRSIGRMIQEDHPTIRYVSPRGWIKKTDYLDERFPGLLARIR
jgi:hypothetical protein